MEGLGMWVYLSSSSGLHSDSSSLMSELSERLRQDGGDSKGGSSSLSCMWQTEFELVPFVFLVLEERVEGQLTALWSCLCWGSSGLSGRASGWDITGSAAAGSSWLFLLCLELFGSIDGGGSVLTSDWLPKQWPRDEQGSPCILADSEMTKRKNKLNPEGSDIRQIWDFLAQQ